MMTKEIALVQYETTEIHGVHGYLPAAFISRASNKMWSARQIYSMEKQA
jgi:hypothetical protein